MDLDGARGSLSTQLDRIEWVRSQPEPLVPAQTPGHWNDELVCLPPGLQFDNGLGGFSADGREYCVLVRALDSALRLELPNGQPGRSTNPRPILPPAPWINVVANPTVGFLISESGAGFTWAGNSQTNRLTGWSNDPVIDPPSEVVYLRDEQTGEIWCPTPLPIPAEAPVLVRHGQGYTVFESNTHGLEHEVTLSVPTDDPSSFSCYESATRRLMPRRLSATFYAEWVLGMTRDASAMHVVTELDPDTGRSWPAMPSEPTSAAGWPSLMSIGGPERSPATAPNSSAAMARSPRPRPWAEPTSPGVSVPESTPARPSRRNSSSSPGETTEIVFQIGEAESIDAVRALVRRYWDPDAAAKAIQESKAAWDES